ncbi:MAG: hypothetical protein KH037_00695 [Burkholderiales bacterium]|nr:hypothetical protein [Burkholderiales bacterium]
MKKNNEVFHISLTELAFTLVLILVMLLGTRLVSEHNKANEQDKIIQQQKEVIETLSEKTGLCRPDPDDPITPLMPCNKCLSVVAHISKSQAALAIDLGKALTDVIESSSLEENYLNLKERLIEAAKMVADGKQLADKKDLIETSEKLEASQKEVASLSKILSKFKEENKTKFDALMELNELRNKVAQCEKDIQTMDTQNKYLARIAGLGYPPCWVGANGKPQYLFNIDLLPDDRIIVNRAWPEERNQDALSMEPVVQVQKYFGQSVPMSEFLSSANKILKISNETKPSACRHFVILKNHIPDRHTGDKQRLKIENSFYKLEILAGDK